MTKIQAVRGMNDILPTETPYWQHFENTVSNLLNSYQYQEIRLPILEKSELFHRGVGGTSDIVEKESYDFADRNGDMLTLRPEGTAGCVRAAIQNGMLRDQTQKLWYKGPMFRHERPQKGRYRQFYQLGVEIYGISNIAIEAELLALSWRLWQQLGLDKHVQLEINNLGTSENREAYKAELVKYLEPIKDQLDEDSQRRLYKNPLRILDSKSPNTQALLKDAPILSDYVDEEITAQFKSLCAHLEALNIPLNINPYLVRGLDYYSHTVFEWTTDLLGAQGTICAGGRYDILIEQLGGPSTPAVGFAMGIERILLLMESVKSFPAVETSPQVYIISAGDAALWHALQLAETLRNTLPHIKVENNTQGGSFKSQFKKADKSGAQLAIIIGENELEQGVYNLKYLQGDKEPETIQAERLEETLRLYFHKTPINKSF